MENKKDSIRDRENINNKDERKRIVKGYDSMKEINEFIGNRFYL